VIGTASVSSSANATACASVTRLYPAFVRLKIFPAYYRARVCFAIARSRIGRTTFPEAGLFITISWFYCLATPSLGFCTHSVFYNSKERNEKYSNWFGEQRGMTLGILFGIVRVLLAACGDSDNSTQRASTSTAAINTEPGYDLSRFGCMFGGMAARRGFQQRRLLSGRWTPSVQHGNLTRQQRLPHETLIVLARRAIFKYSPSATSQTLMAVRARKWMCNSTSLTRTGRSNAR
jgi:hypothetical protein